MKMTKYTILPTWLSGLTPEQQQILLYAVVEYYEGRVANIPSDIEVNFHAAQLYINNFKSQQSVRSDIYRRNANKRWNANNANNANCINCIDANDANNANCINTPSDPQPLTSPALPELPLAPAPTHVINPSHSLLPTNNSSSIYNNILYNKYNYTDITDEDINTIRQIIDAYNDACDKQNVVDIIVSLLHQQEWLARPLLSELTAYLLLCDTARKENYMSVETRLMQAFSTMNKNIETLRQSLLQSVAQNWRTLVPPKQEPQYGSSSTKSPEAISRGVREGLALARANKQRQ